MVAGISMVKDEADFIEDTLRHMLSQVDHLTILDNGSTDGTREILEQLPITVIDDPETGYYQSFKLSRLAERVGAMGAEWIIPFDADERWFAGDDIRIADALGGLPPEALIAEASLFDHVASPEGLTYRRREAAPLRKVACRAREGLTIHQGNHSATYEGVKHPLAVTGVLEVHHYPYRSPEQFVSKVRNGAAAYAASDLPESIGKHWRDYGRTLDERGPEALHEHFYRWFWSEDPANDPDLVCQSSL